MPQEMTKDKVLEYMPKERRYLENTLAKLTETQMIQSATIDNISIKDYLAYLIGWEGLLLGWIESALKDEKPELPAPGMTWYYKDVHKLDHQFIEAFKNRSLKDTREEFRSSYEMVLAKIDQIPEELFTDTALIPREEAGPLGRLIAANTVWHYRRAKTKIREWMKEEGIEFRK